jgi:hypothetical protein
MTAAPGRSLPDHPALRRTLERFGEQLRSLPAPYDVTDVSPFATSPAVYFMDGQSDATIRLRGSGEEIQLEFHDANTSISASAPFLYDPQARAEQYTPGPEPLEPVARHPVGAPRRYSAKTSTHYLQVISMNMRSADGVSRLLIGLPYAEAYPQLFFSPVFERSPNALSFGVVQSLTRFVDPSTREAGLRWNGYPARSFFSILHLVETPLGAFFNKVPSQMELQPSADGKLALSLPPIPFMYTLFNGPIPLFDVADPSGPPVADLVAAHHHAERAAQAPSADAWPWHLPDLKRIRSPRHT